MLRLVEMTYISGGTDDSSKGRLRDLSQLSLKSLLSLLVLIMFTVPLIVLVVVNMYRIFWLWIWICGAPFIILDQVFNGPLQSHQKHGEKFKL